MLGSYCVGFLASASLMLLWSGPLAFPARADHPQPSVGYGMFCDTGEEIETAVGIYSHDIADVLSKVKNRFGNESCSILTGVYFKGDEARTVLVQEGLVHVVKVKLIGFQNGEAWRQLPRPMDQFVAVFEEATRV